MQCKELEEVLEQDGFSPLPLAAREHLASCSACQGLVADLTTIVASARQIPAELHPPDRIWISLRAQLQAEGIIIDQPAVVAGQHAPWWQNISALFRPRVLVSAGVAAALTLAVYFQTHKTTEVPVATTVVAPSPKTEVPATDLANQVTPASAPAPLQQANVTNHSSARDSATSLRPSPSELAGTTLMNVEQDVPNMQLAGNSAVDTSLRQNLRTLNEFIAECQQRLKQNPQDEVAREYLYSAYQQKAELLSAMMESGRSEH
jgi:hypothetical protein